MAAKKKNEQDLGEPLMASYTDGGKAKPLKVSTARQTQTRRNKSSVIDRSDRFINIEEGLVPYQYSKGVKNLSNIDVRDAVILCQKAYYNFSVFRNTVDLMTEFSTSSLYFSGGSKKSRSFFSALFKKINIDNLIDQFFREYYRSGNVFVYRYDADLESEDISKITQVYGLQSKASIKVPARYVILNPADIQIGGNISFVAGKFYKVLTDYELERLKNPRTEEDQQVYDSLSPEAKEAIKKKGNHIVYLNLDSDRIFPVFYKKQDYEPFSVPMGYPVLEDINFKAELKKMDMALTRTIQQAILLVTMGAPPDKGGISQRNLEAMQTLFDNESIGRVLISDYTTEAKFVIPDIAGILDPKKYAVVEDDIRMGLNNVLVGSEKFANTSIKVQVFIERLKGARQAFLNDFLIPEIRRVSQALGFKTYPNPSFHDIDLKDDSTYARIYNRLIELGILTPEEGLEALSTGRLPTKDESVESQEDYRELRDKGFYEPIMGGPHSNSTNEEGVEEEKENTREAPKKKKPNNSGMVGRPPGTTGIPQQSKKVSPIGATFSLTKIQENLASSEKLLKEVEGALRKKHGLRKMSRKQKEVAQEISNIIVANENPQNWSSKLGSYIKNPKDTNPERIKAIESIAFEHSVDYFLASILYLSQNEQQ